MAGSIYRRLTGRRRTLGGYTQLWLAADHLLLVRSTRFVEYYQRFALADIQAIVVTGIPDKMAYQVGSLGAMVIGAAAFLTFSSTLARVLIGIGVAAVVVGAIVNLLRGPRCHCYLQTAVSREILTPIARQRTARRFLHQIRPAIEAVQGSLAPERFAAIDAPQAPVEKPPEVPASPGYLPEALFILFLVDAALVLASVRFPKAQISSALFTTVFGEVVILIVALVRRGKHDPRRIIYALMIAAIFCIGWDALQVGRSFVEWINGVMLSSRREQPPPSLTTWVAFSQPAAIFAATWRIAAGAMGLAAAWFERKG